MDEQVEERSFILVEFASVGSVILKIAPHNVTPLQMLAVASYLDVLGKGALIEQENERQQREAQGKIAQPTPKIVVPGR